MNFSLIYCEEVGSFIHHCLPCYPNIIELYFYNNIWSLPLLGIFPYLILRPAYSLKVLASLPRGGSVSLQTQLLPFLWSQLCRLSLRVWYDALPSHAFSHASPFPLECCYLPFGGRQTRTSPILCSNVSVFLKDFLSFLEKPTFSFPHKL